MKACKKLFGGLEMSWLSVIILSVACAILVVIPLIIPGLDNLSVRNPGTCFEFWILMALVIIVNCKKSGWEAAVKTFVFFLISQPLIYLLQVPFSTQGWNLFQYYPRWFFLTLLTFPGGFIAWYVKKGTVLSGLILSVAQAMLSFELVMHGRSMVMHFPHQILAVLFIMTMVIVLPMILLNNKKSMILCYAVTALSLVGGVGLFALGYLG